MELSMLDKLKYRVQLARKIETGYHKIKKANHDRNWMKEAAAAMEIELDSDYLRYRSLLAQLKSISDSVLEVKTRKKSLPIKSGRRMMPKMLRLRLN